MTDQPAAAPPGRYAGGGRSPIVWAWLCPPCGGYAPFTPEGYEGALSGHCQGCGAYGRETHRFPAFIHSARSCGCTTMHQRVTGDLDAKVNLARDDGSVAG